MISPDGGLSNKAVMGLERRVSATAQDLLGSEAVPVFEEATQTAAHFLEAAICVLGILDGDRIRYKSAVGLSRLGLMNSLASTRQLLKEEAFCGQVVADQQVVAIADTSTHPTLAEGVLAQRYGIRAYLGVPLVTSTGDCVGTLAVMEQTPRNFTGKEIDFLQLMARWSMSEYERDRLLQQNQRNGSFSVATASETSSSSTANLKANLITQMTQELCTPLTSILGMGSVLSQGIYGSLTEKQREYIEIIHNSGQYLMSLVNEIVELGGLNEADRQLNLTPVDIEMLCQQAIATLNQAAQRREQQMQLSVEPGPRIWMLDKDKVRQLIYHLVFSVIQSSSAGGTIRIHVSRKQNDLNIVIWISHPWLGDGLAADMPARSMNRFALSNSLSGSRSSSYEEDFAAEPSYTALSTWDTEDLPEEYAAYSDPYDLPPEAEAEPKTGDRQNLGLQLSSQLAELHGGTITVKGSSLEGYRYVIQLPQMRGADTKS
ncbi:MAG: GAF domain-containing sensor histidine kinase [Oculatellaceae cyanobacterium Prado106]|jgi:hypothetical protein|nr:GAF domain-containing sensor histidine kinase [Oculatellaceae cyanobacterium Prado106]